MDLGVVGCAEAAEEGERGAAEGAQVGLGALAGGSIERLGDDAKATLTAYGWPGSLRELRAVACGVSVTARGRVVRSADNLRHVRRTDEATTPSGRPTAKQASLTYAKQVLAQEGGNVSRAARVLDVARSTLIDWMQGA